MKFVNLGFSNWNDGGRKLNKHQACQSHMDAVAALQRHGSGKVDELLDKQLKQNKVDAHDMLVYVIEAIRFLAKQGLPFRGSFVKDAEIGEPESNLWAVLQSFTSFSDRLSTLLKRAHTYTAPDLQNELLNIMGNLVQRELVSKIRNAKWYCLMVDETPDISGKEQLVICFRYNIFIFQFFIRLLWSAGSDIVLSIFVY